MRAIQTTRGISIGAIMALALLLVLTCGTAKAQLLYDGYNIFSVSNNPTKPTRFYVGGFGWLVTSIADYHYNDGHGVPAGTNVTIELVDANNVSYGTFPAPAPALYPFDNFAHPNVFLRPGWVTVIDSDAKTWSTNAASHGQGLVRVFGTATGQHTHRAPAPPASGTSNFKPCGNLLPSFQVEMSPCTGPSSTIITIMVVRRALAAPLSSVTFRLEQRRFGVASLVLPVTASVTGSGTAIGSLYQVNAPAQLQKLCTAGQYSVWGVIAYDVNGQGLGEMAQFTIQGCP